MDETSSRRGHRYITLFVNVDRKVVLFATEGSATTLTPQLRIAPNEVALCSEKVAPPHRNIQRH
ncbi:hypothetical protein P4H31_29880 [Paenibacillus odorifer]|nr:transposase [Paenibacillus odorifer]MEC0133141.1 hypothetical protein [Paenibacillus odorifer]MEC0225443.1 hypothetical protein [Paenibacillus odorifer]